MRVYLPTTAAGLRAILDAGQLAAPTTGFAVTPALREWYVEGDHEELEYAAMVRAAHASLRMIAAGDGTDLRRIVLAADVAERGMWLDPTTDPAAIRIGAPVPLSAIACALVDDPTAAADVRAAVAALAARDDDTSFVVDSVDDHELAWYAAQELADLLS